MKTRTNIKLNLSDLERINLRKNKVKKSDILDYAVDELVVILDVSLTRAKEIYALVDFQRIPSIGIEFAKDLIFLGYFGIAEVKGEKGADLMDWYEAKKGCTIDSCVEDQFRLVVDFANNENYAKRWWDFTEERKKYRLEFGYPKNRPTKNWTEM